MQIILLGPPGAGKGTLAALLKETFKLAHISTGDLLREQMKANTKLGGEIKKFVENGQLVPDGVVTLMVKQKMADAKILRSGFMLDGFPRTTQAQDLDKILAKIQPIDCALYMESTLPVILKRLTGRRVCRNCGALFHVVNKPPAKEGICDSCGGPLYQRSDDNEETIKKRMDVYLESTQPVIDYYKKQGKLVKVDGDKDSAKLHAELTKIFNADRKSHKDQKSGRN